MLARARRSRSWRSGSATEGWCRRCSCVLGCLQLPLGREEPENGETPLLLHCPLQLLPPRVDPQVNRFVGCDYHIEQGFKMTKRGDWQWPRTRRSDPQRAARLWFAVAVATLWLLSVGGLAEETSPAGTLLALPANSELSPRPRRATQLRLVSVFRQGWGSILVALLNHLRLPRGRFIREPWPSTALGCTQGGMDELPLAA